LLINLRNMIFQKLNISILNKILFSFFLVILNSYNLSAQQNNFSYFKLCVTNKKNEVLLVKYNGIWELAGKKYVDPRTISEFSGFMADELGIKFKDLRLRGLFTFYYNKGTYPILFNYYSAKYKSGQLKIPPGCTDIAWFPIKRAIKIIPFETMKAILTKMYQKKRYVWGASIRIFKKPNSLVNTIKLEEDFYPLSK